MAKNLKRFNRTRVSVINLSAAVASGSIARANGFIGIPLNHAAAGATVAFAIDGVVALTNNSGFTIAAGSHLYFDISGAGTSDITLYPAAGDYYLGQAETAGANGALIDVLLAGTTRPYGQSDS